jgi:hypothetical protein
MDNLKALKTQVDTVIPIGGGVASVTTANHNPFEKAIIDTVGRYTGFPFYSQRSPTAGEIPYGSLYWNANAMNRNDSPFEIFVSKKTVDGNEISRILSLLSVGDMIKFKDFLGRTTTLEFKGYEEAMDVTDLVYYKILVIGYPENTDYAYQVGENEPCMIEFITLMNQNNKIVHVEIDSESIGTIQEQLVSIINTISGFEQKPDENYVFTITDTATTKKAQFLFNAGKGFWGLDGTPVEEANFTQILQNGIPMTGTEAGFPVTGNITTSSFTAFSSQSTMLIGTGNAEADLDTSDECSWIGTHISEVVNASTISSRSQVTNSFASLITRVIKEEPDAYVEVNSNNNGLSGRGLVGAEDFTENIQSLDYTQKKYVDAKVPFKVFSALVTQTGTSDPTVVELQNTLGEVIFTRFEEGTYNITSDGLFIENKTTFTIEPLSIIYNMVGGVAYVNRDSTNEDMFTLYTTNLSSGLGIDDYLKGTFVEIRVYN